MIIYNSLNTFTNIVKNERDIQSLTLISQSECSIYSRCISIHHANRNKHFIIRPMRLIKKLTLHPIYSIPIYIFEIFEQRRTELKRTPIEYNSCASLIHAPQSATIGAPLVPTQQISMMKNISESQFPIVGDYKFLIHY